MHVSTCLWSETAESIPPLDASCSVFSRAQRFRGHNLEQLLGSEVMVIIGKWNHTKVEISRTTTNVSEKRKKNS